MLKISIAETRHGRRVVLEGRLIEPWTAEFTKACDNARQTLAGRQLIIDVKNVTAISQEGENLLIALVREGIKFRCGVFAKQLLRELARRARK